MFGISKKVIGRIVLLLLSLAFAVMFIVGAVQENNGQIIKGVGVPEGFLGGAINAVFIPLLFVIIFAFTYFMLYMFAVVFKAVVGHLTFFSLIGGAMGVLIAFVVWALIGLAITYLMKIHAVVPYIIAIAVIAFTAYDIISTVKEAILDAKLKKKVNELVED